MDFLSAVFVACLVCVGINKLTQKDAVFGFVQRIAKDRNGSPTSDLWNPLFDCSFCMSSLYGVLLAWLCEDIYIYSFLPFLFLAINFVALLALSIISKLPAKLFYFYALLGFGLIAYGANILVLIFVLSLSGLNYVVALLEAAIMQKDE